jgi:hypothetical protein
MGASGRSSVHGCRASHDRSPVALTSSVSASASNSAFASAICGNSGVGAPHSWIRSPATIDAAEGDHVMASKRVCGSRSIAL